MVPSSLEPLCPRTVARGTLYEGLDVKKCFGVSAITISSLPTFQKGGSRERNAALKAWQLLRLAALSGQVPKPAGARRSRREDLKAKARPGDNGCLPYAAALFRPPLLVSGCLCHGL